MDGREFRKWVESSLQEEGPDPWLFLRELSQNSRDAGASVIHVEVERTARGEEVLRFTDNGCGMSFDHARRYLLRLYLSSKEQDRLSAGMFGIGFWTVLRFQPKHILVESRPRKKGKTAWALSLDEGLKIEKAAGRFDRPGTRVTLTRAARFADLEQFKQETKKALLRFCRYLRRRERKNRPLPIFFSGENLTRPIKLPGPVSLSFKKGAIEGAVGLAQQPQVRLYARGLPVWNGTSLAELGHIPSAPEKSIEIARGLAPVFIINGNHLDVTISRDRAMDNRALQRVKAAAETALAGLVQTSAEKVFPPGFFQRLQDTVGSTWRRINRSFARQLLLMLLIIIPLELVVLNKLLQPGKANRDLPAAFLAESQSYSGATVHTSPGRAAPDMSYDPPVDTWFKIFAAERYDAKNGFVRAAAGNPAAPAPARRCSGSHISVRLAVPRGSTIFLAQPVGCVVDPGSVLLNDAPLAAVRFSAGGDAVIDIPANGGTLRYDCCPHSDQTHPLPDAQLLKLTQLPATLDIPPGIEQQLAAYAELSIPQRVQKALAMTAAMLRYDGSESAAARYREAANRGGWFSRVRRIGAGDCDILNGVAAIFLRRMGVPARLAVGLVGEQGRIAPGMHAWSEYYHRGWQVVDASRSVPPLHTPPPGQRADDPQQLPTDSISPSPSQALLYLLATLALFSLALFLVVRQKSRRQRGKKTGPEKDDVLQAVLGQMLLGALLRPALWGSESTIWQRRIIPVLHPKKRAISLKNALKSAKRGRLYIGSSKNPLTRQLIRRGTYVLDRENRAFRDLVALLPGTTDLDTISSLHAVAPEKIANDKDHKQRDRAQLLVKVNETLGKIEANAPACLWAVGLNGQPFMDVHLPQRRFIAVNPGGTALETPSALLPDNPQLAIFLAIKEIVQESDLFALPAERILNKSARLLLEEM